MISPLSHLTCFIAEYPYDKVRIPLIFFYPIKSLKRKENVSRRRKMAISDAEIIEGEKFVINHCDP